MDIEDLKAKALAATPGLGAGNMKFYIKDNCHGHGDYSEEVSGPLYWGNQYTKDNPVNDCNYCNAASPDVILKLLERLEDAEDILSRITVAGGQPAELADHLKKWGSK